MQNVRNVVLVLGAGSANDYGFPTGRGLADNLRTKAAEIAAFVKSNPPRDSRNLPENFAAELDGFLERFPYSGVDTVDEYMGLMEGSPYGFAASVATAYIISQIEASFLQQKFTPHGWYRPLAVRMCEEVLPRGSGNHREPTISVITFNYDKSLEWAMGSVMFARRGTSFTQAMSSIPPICHVHGKTRLSLKSAAARIERRDTLPILAQDWRIYESAEQLRLVCAATGQSNCDADSKEVARAKDLLRGADVVAFLGFGFHQSCLDTLSISPSTEWCKSDTIVTTSSYDMAEVRNMDALRKRVHSRLGILGDTNVDKIGCERVFLEVAALAAPSHK